MNNDIIYTGYRSADLCTTVTVMREGAQYAEALPARYDLRNHSPTGFEWGYTGSGPAQLALALCAHALGDDARALRVYEEFKCKVVSCLRSPWRLRIGDVREMIEVIEQGK